MARRIGVRREDKNAYEARVPLTPDDAARLIEQEIEVFIQPSRIRCYSDNAYREAGATIAEDLSSCRVIIGVKEMPIDFIKREHTYIFFSHTIKGQKHNMPLLRQILNKHCTLVDYEKIVDEDGRRPVVFGPFAGMAGMLDSLWALGRRLEHEGTPNPFSDMQVAHKYGSLERAKRAVSQLGAQIAREGISAKLTPMVFGFIGYGNVSRGAQEVFDLLPHRAITPKELLVQGNGVSEARHTLYKVVFKEEDLVRRRDASKTFDLAHYYEHPEEYRSDFEQYVPLIAVLVNCVYWTPRYPRLVTKRLLKQLYAPCDPKSRMALRVIGDISCDIEGSIECTVKATDPGDPVFVWQAEDQRAVMGVKGKGPVVLAVDNLPCELPRESSRSFSNALMPFLPPIVDADYTQPIASLSLPGPIRRAVIAHHGALAPDFQYLASYLKE